MGEGWQTATLAEKIPENILRQNPKLIQSILSREAKGLKLNWEFSSPQQWLRIRARGPDAEVFLNLLREKFGEAPVSHSRIERWDLLKGFISEAGKVGFGVYVDTGVLEPARKDALYPLHRMRAQLADGLVKSSREILQENAMVDDFPVKVVVTELDGGKITVELADETRDTLLSWRRFPFDRIIAVGIQKERVEDAIRAEGLGLDVIKVQSLSLLTQCLICKIGTEAPGIIAKIGGRLRSVRLSAYRTRLAF